ncbi:hypothetical protein GOHSU_16_00480 [Gordonia hirsuta DSM 44140 = NBRC 16056]|uniref:Uncharacterized protein n=1 Tax=Gordonia hirsuta DSM 44140 = NBRC 16056 TaxID=1121927 RepID=L7LAK9_9ACTN|nr:hypothetical protein [Gordonia hirsuta]GAC57092.1 hypothetical protein GOHSU_16_00480 [Gordonia hirsuta DSM 44140 = NBRC 16056]
MRSPRHVVVLPAVAGALMLTGCGGQSTAPAPSPGVTTVTTESREGIDAAIKVCHQVITSAGVMVRDYNAFIVRLNDTQDYAEIDKEDRYAVDTFNTGADLVREALTPQLPDDIEQKVHDFLTATEQLSEQVSKRHKIALNSAMEQWSRQRTGLIDACGEFMPTGTN